MKSVLKKAHRIKVVVFRLLLALLLYFFDYILVCIFAVLAVLTANVIWNSSKEPRVASLHWAEADWWRISQSEHSSGR